MKAIKVVQKTRLIAVNKNRLLVLEKIAPNKRLTLAGGVTKKKETLLESLCRETHEEIGVALNTKKVFKHISTAKIIFSQVTLKHYFIVSTILFGFKVLEPHKFKAIYWIDWQEALPYLDKDDKKSG